MRDKANAAKRRRPSAEERLDESLDRSFPASDPPAHSGVVPGGPRRRDERRQKPGREKV